MDDQDSTIYSGGDLSDPINSDMADDYDASPLPPPIFGNSMLRSSFPTDYSDILRRREISSAADELLTTDNPDNHQDAHHFLSIFRRNKI